MDYTYDCYDCAGNRYYPAGYPQYNPALASMPMQPMQPGMAPMQPMQPGMMPMQPGMMPMQPGMVPQTGAETPMTATGMVSPPGSGTLAEESFIENILRFNHGRIGTFYFTYQGNEKWNAVAYQGRVETAGRDHIIISNPQTGRRYLLLMSNLDWVEFDGPIAYPRVQIAPNVQQQLTTAD